MKLLNNLSKELSGSVLVIGFEDNSSLVKSLKENKKTTIVYTLNSNGNTVLKKQKKKKKLNGEKDINIKKLSKELKKQKQSFDYIICNFETILPFFRGFIKNSILTANKKVYLYNDISTYNVDEIVYRYKRFGCKVKKEKEKNTHLITIESEKKKLSKLKLFIYRIRDLFYDFFEFIGNILIG